MKKVLLSFLFFSVSVSCFATPYWYKGSGGLEVESSWATAIGGTGTAPAGVFTAGGHTFTIGITGYTGTITMGNNWTVSGSGSKVVLGNGTDAVNLILDNGTANFTIDVVGSNTLTFNGGTYTAVTLGSLSTNSRVRYNQGVNIKTLVGSYGNLTIDAGNCTFPTGEIRVSNAFIYTQADANFADNTSTVNFNGNVAQLIPWRVNRYGNGYKNVTFSGSGVKTFDGGGIDFVKIERKLSIQGVSVGGVDGYRIPVNNDINSILEYKSSSPITTGPEWPAVVDASSNQNLKGGVVIDGTGVVTLNQAKQIGNNTTIPLEIKAGATLSTSLFNYKLTFHGDFKRAIGSFFTAGSSAIEIAGSHDNTVEIAGFTTTGLISFTKSNAAADVDMKGYLPDLPTPGTSIGTFAMQISMTRNGNNEGLNFVKGISGFRTSGDLTLTSGNLYLHKATNMNDLTTASPQINQCGSFSMTSSNAYMSYCHLGTNSPFSSILKLTGNFSKVYGGYIQCISGPSFNGVIQFIGNNQTMTSAGGQNFQTTFQISSPSVVTLNSDIMMNGGYGAPGAVPLEASWEGFAVENGGTLNFSTFSILGGTFFEANAGSTIITSHAQGFYDGINDSGNTLGCIRTNSPGSDVDQTAPNTFISVTNFKRRFFSSDASYIYNGSTQPQHTGLFNTYATITTAGIPTIQIVRDLGVNKTSANHLVSAHQQFTVNGNFKQTNGIFAYTKPTGLPVLTLNGTVSGTTGSIRGNSKCDLIIGNTGIGGGGNMGTLYFDQVTTPRISKGTEAPNDLIALPQDTLGSNIFRRFLVTRNNSTTVTLGSPMRICNVVNVTSGTIASGGNLVMLSTISDSAPTTSTVSSILPLTGGASITGDVVVQSAFNGNNDATLALRGFRMISSPIQEVAYSNTSSKNFFRQIYNRFVVTCATWPSDGCDFKPVKAPNSQTFQSYLEPGTVGNSSFANPNAQSVAETGRGYYFFFRGSRASLSQFGAGKINSPFTPPETWTATYIGTINQGNKSITVTRTNNGEANLDGLNMVGNPYPATLDLQTFLSDNSGVITDFVSIMRPNRTGFVTSSGGIVTNFGNNLLLGDAPAAGNSSIRFIQTGQGFFVRKSAVGSGTVNFTESQKAAEASVPSTRRLLGTQDEGVSIANVAGKSQSQKTVKPVVRKLVRVTLNNNETQEQTTIVLEPGNDVNFSGYDAPYQGNGPIAFNTLTADNKNACINFMPEASLVKEIKLNIFSGTDKNLKLTFDDLTGVDGSDMLLRDNYKNTLTKIKTIKDTIAFEVDKAIPATLGDARFALVFYGKNVLPVQVSDFKVVAQSNAVLLTWNTLSEQNAKNIIVQRSSDGINFVDIKTVEVKGNSTETLNYSFLDITAEVGTVYYRLQKNDVDGSYKFSEVRTVVFGLDADNEIVIFPNPVKTELNVRYKTSQNVNILIYDITGKVVLSFSNINSLNFKANASNLLPGVYVLKLKNAKTNTLIAINKFLKQ